MTARLSEEQKWEKDRFVEFIFPNHGTRVGRVLQNFTRGQAKNRVRLGIFNPNTKQYNNRGGYRGYVVTVEKTMVLKFYGKTKSRNNGVTESSKAPETDDSMSVQ